ncbi:hypothetical protein CMI41_02090 [Candidatus Pacearchaeota archaeon]|nr:hypothetical protein [Candidatus Pacearchaeota archaeon]|tara:strand:- start:1487 stop:1876 length:390 start_codon:yes stop_codon:yes gene_type:complete
MLKSERSDRLCPNYFGASNSCRNCYELSKNATTSDFVDGDSRMNSARDTARRLLSNIEFGDKPGEVIVHEMKYRGNKRLCKELLKACNDCSAQRKRKPMIDILAFGDPNYHGIRRLQMSLEELREMRSN